MSFLCPWPTAAFVCLIAASALLLRHYQWKAVPLPPGPSGWSIIGNIFDMPASHHWKHFARWARQYGDVMSLTLLGQPMIIVNSFKDAYELLEKRSAICSDRPHFIMAGDIVGWDQILVFQRYGQQFREYRRLLARVLGSRRSVEEFAPIIEIHSARLLLRLFQDPSSIADEVHRHDVLSPWGVVAITGAIVLMISYGYLPRERDDPLIRMVEEATKQAAEVVQPGAFLVDVFPWLRYVPSWVPGAGWKRKGETYRANMDKMSATPYQFVKNQMAAGTAAPSFSASMLALNPSAEEEYRIKMSAASIYSGGADTTVSAILSFILAMALYPDIQKKAQAELDASIGNERLPTYSDIAQMPYLNALYLEVQRWNPVVPLGVPHAISADDYYEGYLIPKGSIVVVNQWNMLHDPELYRDPFTFEPNRFLPRDDGQAPETDPRKIAFGFGRRICPGIHLAEASVLVAVAMLLSIYNISDAKTKEGVPITPETVKYTGGTISHPSPFDCTFSPRSERGKALLIAIQDQSRQESTL
ncbi:cytochrome P450 [Trametes meyenii]|nr:cytochrome P450 [Trametes meyenii]